MAVQLLVSVNGGAPQSGGIDVPSAATIQLSAASIVGWKQQRWEIYDYPEGFATPSGWTLQGDGTIVSTDVAPTLITLPDHGVIWGPWGFRLVIDGAVANSAIVIGELVDFATAIHMASPSGQRKPMALEGTQFCTATTLHKKWVRTLQRMMDALENPHIDLVTTNATTTRIRRYPVANGAVRLIRAIIKVQSTDGSAAVLGEWEVKGGYKRVAGTLSAAYAVTITEIFKVGVPGAPTVALNGNTDVDVRVTGIAATNLTWSMSEFTL